MRRTRGQSSIKVTLTPHTMAAFISGGVSVVCSAADEGATQSPRLSHSGGAPERGIQITHVILKNCSKSYLSFYAHVLRLTSEWLAISGRDHLQAAAGKVSALCGQFHGKKDIISSKLILEIIRKVPFNSNKQYFLHQEILN